MRRKLVIGNWKMHGALQQNTALLECIKLGGLDLNCEIAVCPPFPYLMQVQAVFAESGISWGAQTLSQYEPGAFTGEVSAGMLVDFGCRYVLVGHSERRAMFSETDTVVAEKFLAAQRAGLLPVLCVGETLEERESGRTAEVVAKQLSVVLGCAGVAAFATAVVAYEPVWAIGSGLTALPEQAQAVHGAIRAQVSALDVDVARKLRILYGGSVKPNNARELFGQADIDGGLIGGAALVASDFLAICQAAN